MAYDRFLIAPITSGLHTDLKSWLIPDDAWAELNNAYVFRGRVRKRFGGVLTGNTSLTSRVRLNIGTTNGAGNIAVTVPGTKFKLGQQFLIGAEIFTVNALGNPAVMLTTGAAAVHTFDTTTGALIINGAAAATDVFFYPAEPIMGLTTFEVGPINDHPSIAYDTQYAYQFTAGAWIRMNNIGTEVPTWHGDDTNFFWAVNNYAANGVVNYLTTNFQVVIGTGTVTDDPIWGFNNVTWVPFSYSPDAVLNPTNIQPITVTRATAATGAIVLNYVQSARVMVFFKGRMLLLNTIENNATGATAYDVGNPTITGITNAGALASDYTNSTNTAHPWRLRFSANGSPFARNAWLEANQVFKPDIAAALLAWTGGNFLDAATDEAIISAEFIKDRLIVYFERSTWEIVYTGNEIYPFQWQKINTELGSESTFSIVPFDKIVVAIGEQGVHACSGSNVDRIDNKIPDEIFEIRDRNSGVKRVAGIRDYFTEMVYWTIPKDNAQELTNDTYPNKVLVYNYQTGSWAFNDDCITAFGYFEQATGRTWANTPLTWAQSNFTWDSGALQSNFRNVIAGNQQGYIFTVARDVGRNAPVMQITDMTTTFFPTVTIVDHTLFVGDFVLIENAQGVNNINDVIFAVLSVPTSDTVVIGPNIAGTGVYTGGGTVTRVSQITMKSKRWNPYVDKGSNVYVAKIDFGVQKTSNGKISVDYFTSSAELGLVDEGQDTGAALGDNVLETSAYALVPYERQQTLLWHPIYFQADGEFVQIYMNTFAQMLDPEIIFEDFQLEGIVLHTQPSASRLQ